MYNNNNKILFRQLSIYFILLLWSLSLPHISLFKSRMWFQFIDVFKESLHYEIDNSVYNVYNYTDKFICISNLSLSLNTTMITRDTLSIYRYEYLYIYDLYAHNKLPINFQSMISHT